MQLTLDIQTDASKLDEVFVPGQPPKRYDTWREWARWKRGLFTGRIGMKSFSLVYFLAALATCGLGTCACAVISRSVSDVVQTVLSRRSSRESTRSR